MNILKSIFGSSKNSETLVQGAVKGLDAIVFTKEEKSQANQQLSEWYLKYLEATQPQNVARRFIAIIIVFLWAGLIVVGTAAHWFDPLYSGFIFGVLVSTVMDPFLVVIGFYFLTHAVRAYTNKN
jgi:uncharacterized membrane protein (DUF106 family)